MARIKPIPNEIRLPQPMDGAMLDEVRIKIRELVASLSLISYEERQIMNRLINGDFGTIYLEKLTAAPLSTVIRDGMVVYADGTDWDPGSGEGIYAYYGAAWNHLG